MINNQNHHEKKAEALDKTIEKLQGIPEKLDKLHRVEEAKEKEMRDAESERSKFNPAKLDIPTEVAKHLHEKEQVEIAHNTTGSSFEQNRFDEKNKMDHRSNPLHVNKKPN